MPVFFVCEKHNKKLEFNMGRKGPFYACPNYFRRDGYSGLNRCDLTLSASAAGEIREITKIMEGTSSFYVRGYVCSYIYRSEDGVGVKIRRED